MSHANFESLLISYSPVDVSEQIAKQQMLDFYERHPDCFLRSCQKGHFTASAWLLNKQETHVLLLLHKKLNLWLQLGGHCDGDSDILSVALREAQEESGIENIVPIHPNIFDLDIHVIPARENEPEHLHLDIRFLLKTTDTDTFVQNHESLALKWFEHNDPDFPIYLDRMRQKWQAQSVCIPN
ncbi:MAG: hypothetical protein NEHIOOID_00587 [Holosporales bacterium]